jgi:adenylate cyclase
MNQPTILLIEDNPINQQLIAHYLKRENYLVLTAKNGEEGIQIATAQLPQLILLDIMMPGISGFETASRLKQQPETHHIPIIYISALDHIEDKITGFEKGAVDYITKPFSAAEILIRVRTHLKLAFLQQELQAKNEALANANDKITELNQQLYELFGRFATQPVADELLAQGFTLGGKYVHATAMFSDIRGFTRITETEGPAETIRLLNDYFAHMIAAISEEGGIVNQMVGDGLMAIFGAPIPHKDPAERAVRAALKMLARIELFNEAQIAHGRVPIQIGIGIASGQVIAGYLGTQERATYTCVGDPVNLAARLEEHTKYVPYPILICPATQQALTTEFPLHHLGIQQFRGKIEPITVYAVTAPQVLVPEKKDELNPHTPHLTPV